MNIRKTLIYFNNTFFIVVGEIEGGGQSLSSLRPTGRT